MPSHKHDDADTKLHVFLLATTKLEKIDQLNAVAEHRQYPILFLPITAMGEPAHSPEEITGTFKGNKNKKLISCASYLSQYTADQANNALKSLGFSQDDIKHIKFYGAAEDSGLSFDFGGIKHKAASDKFVETFLDTSTHGPYKNDADKELVNGLKRFRKEGESFPGVETVRVLGAAGGVGNFFRLTNLTMKHLDIPSDPHHWGKAKNRILELRDDSTLGAFKWDPMQGKDFVNNLLRVNGLKEGEGVSFSRYDGRGYDKVEPSKREITTFGASIPRNRAAQGHMTSRDDLGAIYQPAARGEALKELMQELGISAFKGKSWTKFVEERGRQSGRRESTTDYNVALIPGDDSYPHKAMRTSAKKALADKGMKVSAPGSDGKTPEHYPRMWDDMGHFQSLIQKNDAFVFMPSGAKEELDKTRELELFLAASYAAVHKTLDPQGKGKTLVLLEQEPGDFERLTRQMVRLFNHGAFGDRPSKLFHKATSVNEALEVLQEARAQYRPVAVHPEKQAPVPDIKNKTGKYNVCVFLSASMEGVYEDKAEALGKRIQASGMGLAYGAGDRNMMGGVYRGALSAARKRKEEPAILGSTTRVIATTECEKGTKPEHIPDDMFYMAPDITKRKEFLFKNSHAFVALEGGVGTLDELITYIWYKDNDPDMVKNKPFVIAESAYTKDSMFKQTLDLYLGQDSSKLRNGDRKAIFKKTGIMIMDPPAQLQEGSKRTLYQMETDAVIEFLKTQREKTHPELVPENTKSWVGDVQEYRTNAKKGTIRH